MKIGYARVSTIDQSLDLQNDALSEAGCEKIFTDKISSAKAHRPGLEKTFAHLRKGDTLVIWRLDRLGRSIKNLIELSEKLREMEVGLKSLQEAIDTTTSGGKLVFHMFSALAEFERNLITERTNAGLRAARARGRMGGRKKTLNEKKRQQVVELYHSRDYTVEQICGLIGISRGTLYRYVNEANKNGEIWNLIKDQ